MTMRNKTFTLLGLSILTLVVLISCVSATACLNLTEVSVPIEINQDDGTLTVSFELSNRGACTVDKDLIWSIISNRDDYGTWDNSSLPTTINMGDLDTTPKEYSVTFTFENNIPIGKMAITISVNDGATDVDEFILDLTQITITKTPKPEEVDECITTGSTGNLKLSIEDFSVEKGYGEDN